MKQMTYSQKQSQRSLLLRWFGWFCFANTILYYLIGINYLLVINPFAVANLYLYGKFIIITFIVFSYLGHFALLAILPGIIIVPLILVWPRRYAVISIATLLASLSVIYLLVDSFVFRQFRFHLNGVILHMIFSGEATQIFSLSFIEYLIISILFLIFILLEIFIALQVWRLTKRKFLPGYGIWVATILGLCFYLSLLFIVFSSGQLLFRTILTAARFLPFYNTVLAAVMPGKDALIALQKYSQGFFLQPEQYSANLNYPIHPMQCQPRVKPYNLVWIVIDTWRFDTVTPTIMPNLYQFSQQSLQFDNHFSGGNATRTGIFSLFYALSPTYWTAMEKQQRPPVFMQILQQQHYQMGIFASAELKAPAFNKTVFASIKNLTVKTPGDNPEQRDRYITQAFIRFISHAIIKPQPFFGFLFYDASHSFCNVPSAKGPLKPVIKSCNRIPLTGIKRPELYINRYKNALTFIDGQLKQIFQSLRQRQLMANTVVVITGDHGQEFDDNHLGYWGHATNFTRYQLGTPLIIYWPNKPSRVIKYQTSHYDIVPTLIHRLLGCHNPSIDYSIGQGLFNNQPRPYLIVGSYNEFGIVEPKRIVTIYDSGLYQIDNKQGRPIADAKLNNELMQHVFTELRRFFKK